jgi:hypothetical protein
MALGLVLVRLAQQTSGARTLGTPAPMMCHPKDGCMTRHESACPPLSQGSIQGSVLSKSDPTEPELNQANTGHTDPPDPLGDLITRRSRVRIPPEIRDRDTVRWRTISRSRVSSWVSRKVAAGDGCAPAVIVVALVEIGVYAPGRVSVWYRSPFRLPGWLSVLVELEKVVRGGNQPPSERAADLPRRWNWLMRRLCLV